MEKHKKKTWKWILENLLIFWSCLIIIFLLFEKSIFVPNWLMVVGRSHPLILHFPIVFLILTSINLIFKDLLQKISIKWISLITANFTGLTVLAGLILSQQDYEGSLLDWHKWTGILIYLISIGVYFLPKNTIYFPKIIGIFLLIGIIMTGHFGAELTHGENFLTGPLVSSKNQEISENKEVVFNEIIQPILENKCVECHRDGKTKGDLRLDNLEGIQKGGKTGSFFLAGNIGQSLFLNRIHLGIEEKEHMPPKNKSQLTKEEIEILELWVKAGGSFTEKFSDLPENHPLISFKPKLVSKKYNFVAANQQDVEDLNNFFRKVRPLFPGSPALEVSYYGSSSFDIKSLNDLVKVKENIIKINLNRMPLSGTDLNLFTKFQHLEELQLNFTNISGEQIKNFKNIPNLKRLAITGNPIKKEDIKFLAELKQIKELYFWQPNWEGAWREELQKQLPKVEIDFGFDDEGIMYSLNAPKIKVDKQIFQDSVLVEITHPIPNTIIRYNLDGTDPDSLNSPIYQAPLYLKNTADLKARAFNKGWYGSPSEEKIFYKNGYRPKSFILKYPPNKSYSAMGDKTLFDGIKGKANHTSGEWLGYTDTNFEMDIELKENQHPNTISLSLLFAEGSYIFPPDRVNIWLFQNNQWKPWPIKQNPQSNKIAETRFGILTYPLPETNFEKIRVQLKPINPLPKWHPGAGGKGWVFIDEILLN